MSINEQQLQAMLQNPHVRIAGQPRTAKRPTLQADIAAQDDPPLKTKYRNKKVYTDEGVFDSKKEWGRYQQLKMLRDAGKIFDLQRQVTFTLVGPEKLAGEKKTKPAIRYVADFVYVEGGRLVIDDTKSEKTRSLPAYRIKKHLMKSQLGLDIIES